MVWTGDSARHDSDENIPRDEDEVLSTNRRVAAKFLKIFGSDDNLKIPVVSTFGNNDILPHNILLSGPNKWLKTYADIWSKFIPEEQRHGFERGGWYYVEVIPKKLAVFSLNTLYFFSHNAAVDGCALRSEPGYEHMEWLRIQLQFMRERGMKAILTGHVPPARTESKQLWDETCWQKYTLWLQQYRDVVVGGLYGHMNIDHFMIHDTEDIDLVVVQDQESPNQSVRTAMDDEFTIESASDYLEELRHNWSDLPKPPVALELSTQSQDSGDVSIEKKKTGKRDKYKKIGGPWGERFQVTNVGPSVVPNYFPTVRVVEYNITGLDATSTWANPTTKIVQKKVWLDADVHSTVGKISSGNKNGKKDKKKPTNPDLTVPSPPSKNSPPGPAYSPQTLTLLGYTQYYANLTYLNNIDYVEPEDSELSQDDLEADKWHGGKHKGKLPKHKEPKPKKFQYQVEYDTFTDPVYKLKDMTVGSYLELARRIGQYKPAKEDSCIDEIVEDAAMADSEDGDELDGVIDAEKDKKKGKKHHKKKKNRKQAKKNKVWLKFVQRAFVGTLDSEDMEIFDFESSSSGLEALGDGRMRNDVHDGEL